MTKEEALDLVSSKLQEDYVAGKSYTHWFVEIDDIYEIIDKIFSEPTIDCSFNNLVNSTIIIR